MVKRYVRKCTNRKHFSVDQLITLSVEIEAILNSRPLTYVYEDIESGFTLTPAHFLVTNQKLGLHNTGDIDYHGDEDFQPNVESSSKLIELWKKGQKRVDLFWRVWKEEYLISLRERIPLEHKLSRSESLEHQPRVGSIVIVKDGNVPRGNWKLVRLIISRDSKIRSADVQLGKSVVCRPINHLYPLELPNSELPESCTDRDLSQTIDANQKKKINVEEKAVEDNVDRIADDYNEHDDRHRRKASLRAQRAIYHYLNDDCSTVLFCFPQEC